MSSSFHVCTNCDGSCERVARGAMATGGETAVRGSIPKHAPWGAPDHREVVKPGIIEFGTPSYGGWYVAPDVRAKIPACVQLATRNRQGVTGWFEEDNDVSWVVACLPELFGEQKATAACGVLSRAFDSLRLHMDELRARHWTMALRYAYAKNGLLYGWTDLDGGSRLQSVVDEVATRI